MNVMRPAHADQHRGADYLLIGISCRLTETRWYYTRQDAWWQARCSESQFPSHRIFVSCWAPIFRLLFFISIVTCIFRLLQWRCRFRMSMRNRCWFCKWNETPKQAATFIYHETGNIFTIRHPMIYGKLVNIFMGWRNNQLILVLICYWNWESEWVPVRNLSLLTNLIAQNRRWCIKLKC